MLNNVYLAGIDNPTSRRYAVITAYNGGAGSVLRVFSSDKVQAANIINSMAPGDVYQTLTPAIRRRNRAAICTKLIRRRKATAVNSPPPDSGLSPALRPRLFSAILCNIFRFSAAVNRSIKLVNDRITSK